MIMIWKHLKGSWLVELDLRKPMAAGVRGHEQSVLSSLFWEFLMHDLHCLNKFEENFWIHLTLSLQHDISCNYVTSVWFSFGYCMATYLIYLCLHCQWPHYGMVHVTLPSECMARCLHFVSWFCFTSVCIYTREIIL